MLAALTDALDPLLNIIEPKIQDSLTVLRLDNISHLLINDSNSPVIFDLIPETLYTSTDENPIQTFLRTNKIYRTTIRQSNYYKLNSAERAKKVSDAAYNAIKTELIKLSSLNGDFSLEAYILETATNLEEIFIFYHALKFTEVRQTLQVKINQLNIKLDQKINPQFYRELDGVLKEYKDAVNCIMLMRYDKSGLLGRYNIESEEFNSIYSTNSITSISVFLLNKLNLKAKQSGYNDFNMNELLVSMFGTERILNQFIKYQMNGLITIINPTHALMRVNSDVYDVKTINIPATEAKTQPIPIQLQSPQLQEQ